MDKSNAEAQADADRIGSEAQADLDRATGLKAAVEANPAEADVDSPEERLPAGLVHVELPDRITPTAESTYFGSPGSFTGRSPLDSGTLRLGSLRRYGDPGYHLDVDDTWDYGGHSWWWVDGDTSGDAGPVGDLLRYMNVDHDWSDDDPYGGIALQMGDTPEGTNGENLTYVAQAVATSMADGLFSQTRVLSAFAAAGTALATAFTETGTPESQIDTPSQVTNNGSVLFAAANSCERSRSGKGSRVGRWRNRGRENAVRGLTATRRVVERRRDELAPTPARIGRPRDLAGRRWRSPSRSVRTSGGLSRSASLA